MTSLSFVFGMEVAYKFATKQLRILRLEDRKGEEVNLHAEESKDEDEEDKEDEQGNN